MKPRSVSLSGTYAPGVPVNFSATNIGWDRKRWMRLARATVFFILVTQLFHTEDGDDILQLLILLQRLLHAAGDAVVLLADDVRLKDTRGGGEEDRPRGRCPARISYG